MRVEQQAWIQSSSSYDYDLEQQKMKASESESNRWKCGKWQMKIIMAAEEIGGNKNGGPERKLVGRGRR